MERIINITDVNSEEKSVQYEDKKQIFTHIFNLYYKRVYNYTYYRVNNREHAEDLTSIIFEKVLSKIWTYSKSKANFEVWLFTIAKNTINDFFRKQKRRKIVSLDSIFNMVSKEKGPEDIVVNKEVNNELGEALGTLSIEERNILAYKFGADLKNKEIAQILNISESNVGVKLHRIMKKLKSNLEMGCK